jgi:predicted  nucleic acid-binding Zn-ribbon protein
MSIEIVDKCPTCGSNRFRQGSKDKALVAWGHHGTGLVMEITKNGVLANQIDHMSDWAEEVFADLEDVEKEGMSVWEGVVVINEEGERACKGKFRNLTDEEWGALRDESPLW